MLNNIYLFSINTFKKNFDYNVFIWIYIEIQYAFAILLSEGSEKTVLSNELNTVQYSHKI